MSLSLLLLELLLPLELLLLLVRVFPLSRPGHLDLQQARRVGKVGWLAGAAENRGVGAAARCPWGRLARLLET